MGEGQGEGEILRLLLRMTTWKRLRITIWKRLRMTTEEKLPRA